MNTKRITTMSRPEAVRIATAMTLVRNGIDCSAVKKAIKYALHLLRKGNSAAWAITKAIRYGHVLSNPAAWQEKRG